MKKKKLKQKVPIRHRWGVLAKNQHQSVANSMPEIEHNLRLEQKIFPPNLPIANLGLQQIDSPFGPHCDEMARFKI